MDEQEKMKVKERLSADEMKTLLSTWLDALEKGEDLDFELKGEKCFVPFLAFQDGKIKAEFEVNEDECEFEIKLKWDRSGHNKGASGLASEPV